jgi:hypothetical protein
MSCTPQNQNMEILANNMADQSWMTLYLRAKIKFNLMIPMYLKLHKTLFYDTTGMAS